MDLKMCSNYEKTKFNAAVRSIYSHQFRSNQHKKTTNNPGSFNFLDKDLNDSLTLPNFPKDKRRSTDEKTLGIFLEKNLLLEKSNFSPSGLICKRIPMNHAKSPFHVRVLNSFDSEKIPSSKIASTNSERLKEEARIVFPSEKKASEKDAMRKRRLMFCHTAASSRVKLIENQKETHKKREKSDDKNFEMEIFSPNKKPKEFQTQNPARIHLKPSFIQGPLPFQPTSFFQTATCQKGKSTRAKSASASFLNNALQKELPVGSNFFHALNRQNSKAKLMIMESPRQTKETTQREKPEFTFILSRPFSRGKINLKRALFE